MLRIGLVAASDRASSGVYEDRGTPALREYLGARIITPHEFVERLIADDYFTITGTLIDLADNQHCSLIFTTGGTGPSPRDVTPEATESVVQKVLPGFGEVMRRVSYNVVPTAILSRQIAGIRNTCLIVNLPGKPSAIAECLNAVMAAIPDCVATCGGPSIEMVPEVGAFNPHIS
ncbi:MAG: molybdopterin adenylyltransferase [Actinomycetes bacterium]|jgi:molybdopterin adenylyltransferase